MWPADRTRRVGLAVSGGPDSLALLVLADEVLRGCFEAATIDHGLRAEAADEAAMVAALCAGRGIPHHTIGLELDHGPALQERARDARYAALVEWANERGLAGLVTAHHADDQAETLVMRLNRGAGVRGLAGMRPRSAVPGGSAVPLLRPLLGWRRDALHAVTAAADLVPADDPSNRDLHFERVRIRSGLASADWIDPQALANAARHLADADEVLDWAAESEWCGVEIGADACTYAPAAPRAVRLRVLARIVDILADGSPRGRDLARWLDALEAGGVATLGGIRGDGSRMPWRFAVARPHRARSPSTP